MLVTITLPWAPNLNCDPHKKWILVDLPAPVGLGKTQHTLPDNLSAASTVALNNSKNF